VWVVQESHGGGGGVSAVSKGVIQRDHQHAVTITGSNLYQPPNPFNRITEDDVDSYEADVVEKHADPGKLLSFVTHHPVLQPLYKSTCVSGHLQLGTGRFCWCKVLLPTCPC